MRRIQSLFFLLLLAFFSQAQNTCDCQENLKLLDEILSNNYAGYQYKKKTNGIVLDKLYNELLKEAKKERYQNYNCARLLDAYITAYEDKHTNIDYLGLRHSIGKMSENEKTALFGIVAENKYLDSKQLSRYVEELQRGIEGVYVNKEDTCIVLEDRNILHDYIGVLWNTHQKYWNRGDVKFELKQNSKKQYDYFYYDKNHSLESLRDIDISINNIAGWRKIHAKSDSLIQEENRFLLSVQKPADSTLYLPLQTFDRSYKAVIDNFLDSNKEKLEKTPNLILDLRGNKGGADDTFSNLIPYLYTNPVLIKGVEIYCSQNTIENFEEYLKNTNSSFLQKLVERMKNNNNKFILLHDSEGYTIQLDTVLQYPKNIYIIVDKECASSAEEFILISKQSSKVTILGENTSGCLDFSNVVRFDPKDDNIGKWWGVNYASTISKRLPNDPVDEKGIAPDIYLSPDKNWLDEVYNFIDQKYH